MALAAPLEDFCEALVGSKGLKRLVKCSNKRSRENHSNGRDVNESRSKAFSQPLQRFFNGTAHNKQAAHHFELHQDGIVAQL